MQKLDYSAKSYINEHTAEYYLVPELKKILNSKFQYVAPIFPWLSRELSNSSKQLHGGSEFKVLAMFPRRPKITGREDGKVYVTINQELAQFKALADRYHIPVIAGCPHTMDLWDLACSDNFFWIKIDGPGIKDYLNPLDVHLSPLKESDIIRMVDNGQSFNLSLLEKFIRETRISQPSYLMYGARYRPVYYLIKTI
jgi:hypothetical protein